MPAHVDGRTNASEQLSQQVMATYVLCCARHVVTVASSWAVSHYHVRGGGNARPQLGEAVFAFAALSVERTPELRGPGGAEHRVAAPHRGD